MKQRKNKRAGHRKLWVSLAVSFIFVILGVVLLDDLNVREIVRRLVQPLCRLLFFISMGLALGQLIEAAGWTGKLGVLGAPFFRFAGLGPYCSAAFSTGFFSIAAANAMLYGYWKDGRISRHQLILANLANQLPAFFLHLPTTVFIVLPLTGWAGGLYFILTFVAVMLRFLLVLIWGHFFQEPPNNQGYETKEENERSRSKAPIWETLKKKLPDRIVHIATYVVPIYIAVFLLNKAGVFDRTQQWLGQWVASSIVPVEALSLVVLGFVAEFTSGFAAAGAMLQEGVITTKQAVLALLIGNVLAFPIRAVRHQLPRLLGIFAPRLGLQILFLGQGVRILSLLVVGVVYYYLF